MILAWEEAGVLGEKESCDYHREQIGGRTEGERGMEDGKSHGRGWRERGG